MSNSTKVRPETVETVSCDVCLKEIPASEARVAEAVDYVAHFCGLECYDKWRRQNEEPTDK